MRRYRSSSGTHHKHRGLGIAEDFGWDPVFEPAEGEGKTFAEMTKPGGCVRWFVPRPLLHTQTACPQVSLLGFFHRLRLSLFYVEAFLDIGSISLGSCEAVLTGIMTRTSLNPDGNQLSRMRTYICM